MRYLTLTILLSGALAAQTPNWWQRPDLPQYFKQFKIPLAKPPSNHADALPRTCAIPLTNALKKDTTNDRMSFKVNPSQTSKMPVVPPPAPSCDDVR